MLEVFQFIISLISPEEDHEDSDDLCILGLSLARTAIEAAKGKFVTDVNLIHIVQKDLFQALLQAATSANLLILSETCSVAMALYMYLKVDLRHQLASFVTCVLMRVAEGKDASYEQQEVVLESLVDFCRHPTFMLDMYANMDCAVDCMNVFEGLANLLSKNTFPVNSPLATIHLLSLQGLLAVVTGIQKRCEGPSVVPALAAMADPPAYVDDLWEAAASDDFGAWAEGVKRKKYLKRRLAIGADHFNRDHKKGFEFLQSINLLPTPLEAVPVAKLLRYCPGLNKNVIGEMLGSPKDFDVAVLGEFVQLFEFTGLTLDMALRVYLESFFLPGEAQKIARILEVFAERYYKQNPRIMANPDAVYILSYSLLMLHTDAHNNQVKKKMTLEEFIRNNRKINDGEDLPREVLTELYYNIGKHEIRIKDEGNQYELSAAQWAEVVQKSQSPKGKLRTCLPEPHFDRDMFGMIWGPAIAALSVVFDHAEDEFILQEALGGFLAVAKIASHYQIEEVIDNLVISLCKFTALLSEKTPNAQVTMSEDTKAVLAVVTVFCIANKHGDNIRSGWRNIVDCIVRLHKLKLLPANVTQIEEMKDVRVTTKRVESQASQTKSLLHSVSTQLSSFMSSDRDAGKAEELDAELEDTKVKDYVQACRIDEIFTDSKFLQSESLEELVKALVWASGEIPRGLRMAAEEEETRLLCLDLLLGTTFRNRDRILLLWPSIHDHLAAIISAATDVATPLVERAVFGLLRLCQRLVPYKEHIAEELLQALQLVLKLDAKVAELLAEQMTVEVLYLLKGSASLIKYSPAWRTICSLLILASHHPEACKAGYEALECALTAENPRVLSAANFKPLLEAVASFVAGFAGGEELAWRAFLLLQTFQDRLREWSSVELVKPNSFEESQAILEDLWWALIKCLVNCVGEQREQVRNKAAEMLESSVLMGEQLQIYPSSWVKVLDDVAVPQLETVLGVLANSKNAAAFPNVGETARVLVSTLTKVVLGQLDQLKAIDAFPALWIKIMTLMEGVCTNADEDLTTAGVEGLRSMLIFTAQSKVLTPDWVTPEGVNVWGVTWQKAHAISPNLSPEILH